MYGHGSLCTSIKEVWGKKLMRSSDSALPFRAAVNLTLWIRWWLHVADAHSLFIAQQGGYQNIRKILQMRIRLFFQQAEEGSGGGQNGWAGYGVLIM